MDTKVQTNNNNLFSTIYNKKKRFIIKSQKSTNCYSNRDPSSVDHILTE